MALLTEREVTRIGEKAFGGERGLRVVAHEWSRKSEEDIGYLGKHLTLGLEVSLGAASCRKKFFVKTYEAGAPGENYLEESGIFRREVDFYRFVGEDLRESIRGPEWCPKYFFSKERVLVLEELSEKGFTMAAGGSTLDRAHLEAALRTLAAMHASSLAFEAQQSKSLPAMYPTVLSSDILYDETKPKAATRKWISWQIEDLTEGIEYLGKYSPEERTTIRERFRGEVMRIFSLSRKSDKYRNVLTHGDMWRNNLLFRYSPENLPVECRFVDFQFVRYTPPAHDVMHLLHYVTTKVIRDREEVHYLRFYYGNLRERLRELDLDVEEEITGETFVESCKEYKELALIQCLLSLHYLLGGVTIKPDGYQSYEEYLVANRKQYMREFFGRESYAERVADTFRELIDGYILKE